MYGNLSFDADDYFEISSESESTRMPVDEVAFNQLKADFDALKVQLETARQQQGSTNAQNENNGQATNTVINAVTEVKLTPFFESDPELWFVLVESQFAARQITSDKTKYFHTVSHLTSSVASRIKDKLIPPYENGKYESLKKELIAIFSESATEKFEKLISSEPLGDMKPSQALHKIRALAAGTVTDDFVKKLWLKRLPHTTRSVLAASNDTLDALAKMADSMWEVSDRSAISSVSQGNSLEKTLQLIQQQIEKLSNRVNSGDERKSRRDATPHYQRNRSKSKTDKSTSERENKDDVCWYHRKWSDKATKCREPCAYSKN